MATIDDIVQTAMTVFRDYQTPGVPSTKAWEPPKAEVRALFVTLASILQDIIDRGFQGDDVKVTTWAELAAIPPVRAGQLGVVQNDAGTHSQADTGETNVPNQGSYSGTAGGLWKRVGDYVALSSANASKLETLIGSILDTSGASPFVRVTDDRISVTDEFGFEMLGLSAAGLEYGGMAFVPSSAVEGLVPVDRWGFETQPSGQSTSPNAGQPGTVTQFEVGGVVDTDDGGEANIVAEVDGPDWTKARVELSTDAFGTNVVFISDEISPTVTDKVSDGSQVWRTAKWRCQGLPRNTRLYCHLFVDGRRYLGSPPSFLSWPEKDVPADFVFWFGSCSRTSQSPSIPMLDYIARQDDFHFLLHLGDFVYDNITANDIYALRAGGVRLGRAHASLAAVLRKAALIVIYDDHDGFGANDNNRDNTAWSGYQKSVQAWLEAGAGYRPMQIALGEIDPSKLTLAQQFDIAHCRFIVMDTRVQSTKLGGTVLGNGVNPVGSWNQVAAIKAALVQAGADGIKHVFLCSPRGIGNAHDGLMNPYWSADYVGLCNYIRDTPGIPFVTVLSGDFHWSHVDFSTYTDKSTGGGCLMPGAMSSAFMSNAFTDPSLVTSWPGTPTRSGKFTSSTSTAEFAIRVAVKAAGGWQMKVYGAPFDEDGVPTLLDTFDCDEVALKRTVQFASSTLTVPAGEPILLPMLCSGLGHKGGGAAEYKRGSEAAVPFELRPMARDQTVTAGNAPSTPGQTVTITLQNPAAYCALGATTSITVTAS